MAVGVPLRPARASNPWVAYVYGSGDASVTANPFKTLLLMTCFYYVMPPSMAHGTMSYSW